MDTGPLLVDLEEVWDMNWDNGIFDAVRSLSQTSELSLDDLTAMDVFLGEDVKEHCLRTLAEVGAPLELSNFYADVLQCEYDMTRTVYYLYNDLTSRSARIEFIPPDQLYSSVQNITKTFRGWKTKVDELADRRLQIPPFQVSSLSLAQSPVRKAVCSFETDQVNLHEGDELTITDASRPNWLRVRNNSSGEEGYVPALSCIIPTPDSSALTAVERLQILLMTSWAECMYKIRSLLSSTMTGSVRQITARWNTWLNGRKYNGLIGQGLQKVVDMTPTILAAGNKELGRLHRHLCRIESELIGLGAGNNGLLTLKETIGNLDKSVLCFQTFYVQWRNFRRELCKAPRPIRIVEQWEKLRRASQFSNFKYLELKMTLEEYETVEEIVHKDPTENQTPRSNLESAKAEAMTKTSQEERKHYIIQGVIDPRTGEKVSLREAVASGIINYKDGLYVNPDTGQGTPITEAMMAGNIIVEYSCVRRSPPFTDIISLITIRRRIIDNAYTITGAIDAMTAEHVDCAEAIGRGLIDLKEAEFVNNYTQARMPLDEAIDAGWVFAVFDDDGGRRKPRFTIATHAVVGVVDRRIGRVLPFTDAIRHGLIDRRTGDYVDNATGRRVYLSEAIRQGLIKTQIVHTAAGDPDETAVVPACVSRPSLPANVMAVLSPHKSPDHGKSPGLVCVDGGH